MIELSESVGRAMWLRKGATHKYIRRVPKPGGGYRYYYRATGATRAVGSDLLPGAKFKLTHEGQAGHFEVVRRAGNQVVLRHDESGGTMTVEADALGDLLKREHADVVSTAQARVKRDLEAAKKYGSPKQIARLEERAKRLGMEVADKPKFKMRDSAPIEAGKARVMDALAKVRGLEGVSINEQRGESARRFSDEPGKVYRITRGRPLKGTAEGFVLEMPPPTDKHAPPRLFKISKYGERMGRTEVNDADKITEALQAFGGSADDAAEAAADRASMLDAVRDARKDTEVSDRPDGGLRGVLSDGWAYSDLISVSPETTYDQMVERLAGFISRAHWPQPGVAAAKKFMHAWHRKTRGVIPHHNGRFSWNVQDAVRAAIKAAGHDPDDLAPRPKG